MSLKEDLSLSIEPATSATALALMNRLDADLRQRYPGYPILSIDPQQFDEAGGVFVIARLGEPVGCGALRRLEDGVGEIKRMFVDTAYRGRGIARTVLQFLEETARQQRMNTLRLETGLKQPEAIRLYESSGYTSIPRFGEYAEDPHSLCYQKRL